jgi:hypothetical protein
MLADPVALARRDFQCNLDVSTGVVRSVNPFGDTQVRIEKDQKVWMREFRSGLAVLKTDRFEKRIDVWLI